MVNDGKLDSLPDLVEIRTGALPNTAPIANAGLDQAVDLGATVQLDGSASSDPDHGPAPLTYSWSLLTRPAGSVAVISNATAIKPTFKADKAGEYVAQLIVNDSAASSSPDTVRISTRNTKPVANAGNDQSGAVGVTVNLDGRGSFDADGDPLSYQWSFTSRPAGSVAAIGNPQLPQSNFIPDKPGLYVVQLVVDDGKVASDPDTATITIVVPVVPGLTINDVNIVEGNSGTKTLDVYGDGRAGADGTGDGQLRHGLGHGHQRHGLHGSQRAVDVRGRRRHAHHRRDDQWRHDGRARRDVQCQLDRAHRRDDHRCTGHRHDHQRRHGRAADGHRSRRRIRMRRRRARIRVRCASRAAAATTRWR